MSEKQKCNRITIVGKNDMWTTNPELARLLLNPEDGYKYMQCSNKKTDWKCPNCENIIKNKNINHIKNRGLSCPICSDGISYPQKFMANVLKELNVDFEPEQKFNWCVFKLNEEDYQARYDFVFNYNDKNYIIEADGGLGHGNKIHPKNTHTKEELIYVDEMKDRLAIENNYELIRIDCHPSEFEYIKNSILNSKLNNLFDLYRIDWNKCNKNSLKSKIIEACDLWNDGIKSTKIIGDTLKVSQGTIIRYLKQGTKIDLCDYDAKQSIINTAKLMDRTCTFKSVVCINTKEIFESIVSASKKYNISDTRIICCCKARNKSAGKHPETGEKLIWEYYDSERHKNYILV